ncbi:MAG TPA: hypothetical protein VKY90_06210 [Candidatus Dormibacteraeota bacterium]|nr:hypothetical protein [Candidatus Dormibacteraeota bacterium]
MARDAITTVLEVPSDAFEVVVKVALLDWPEAEVARARKLRGEAKGGAAGDRGDPQDHRRPCGRALGVSLAVSRGASG